MGIYLFNSVCIPTQIDQPTYCGYAFCSCVFTVITVMDSNTIVDAVDQACLTPNAYNIIIVDWTSAFPIGCSQRCTCGFIVTELPAHHISIIGAPDVITDSPPCTIEVHFHTPRDMYMHHSGTSLKPNVTILELCIMTGQNEQSCYIDSVYEQPPPSYIDSTAVLFDSYLST